MEHQVELLMEALRLARHKKHEYIFDSDVIAKPENQVSPILLVALLYGSYPIDVLILSY